MECPVPSTIQSERAEVRMKERRRPGDQRPSARRGERGRPWPRDQSRSVAEEPEHRGRRWGQVVASQVGGEEVGRERRSCRSAGRKRDASARERKIAGGGAAQRRCRRSSSPPGEELHLDAEKCERRDVVVKGGERWPAGERKRRVRTPRYGGLHCGGRGWRGGTGGGKRVLCKVRRGRGEGGRRRSQSAGSEVIGRLCGGAAGSGRRGSAGIRL